MDVIDIVRDQRPDAAPMDPAARAELRVRLTGEMASVVVADEPVQHAVDPTDNGATPVHWWLSVAAILLVGACLAAVILVTTRPDAAPPVAPPPTPADPGPLYPSATVPVVESLPDPFAIGELDGVVSVPVAPPTTTVGEATPTFPLLAITEGLPEGYRAALVQQDGSVGIVWYASQDSTTELQLVIRADRSFYDQLVELGRTSWEVDGITVYDAGEGGGGCLPDVCSIGFLWGDDAFVSLTWGEPNGGALAPGATHGSLLDLVSSVGEDPALWRHAGAIEEPPAQEAGDRPIMLPLDAQAVENVSTSQLGPDENQIAVLVDDDGSMFIVTLTAVEDTTFAFSADRTIGDVGWRALVGAQLTLYDSWMACGVLRVDDGGSLRRGGTGTVWRDGALSFLDRIEIDGQVSSIDVTGLSTYGVSNAPDLYSMSLLAEVDGVPSRIEVLQGPGSNAAFAGGFAARDLAPFDLVGPGALAGTSSFDPEVTTVMWWHEGTSVRASAEGLTAEQIVLSVEGRLQWSTVDVWHDRYGEAENQPITLGPDCTVPLLTTTG